MTKRIAHALIVAGFALGALVGMGGTANANDELCAKATVWQPVGKHTVCIPLP